MLKLVGDVQNCRLEIYKITGETEKQVFDIPLVPDVMIFKLDDDSILVQYKDTTHKIVLHKEIVCYNVKLSDVPIEDTTASSSLETLHKWLKSIRNTCNKRT